jgi:hypothetical protein
MDGEDQIPDYMNLTDDEFLKLDPNSLVGSNEAPAQAAPEADADQGNGESGDDGEGDEEDPSDEGQASGAGSDDDDPDGDDDASPAAAGTQAGNAEASSSADGHTTPNQSAPTEDQTSAADGQQEAPNYEELYKKIMAPFKANGKEFAPTNPEEAVRLMQMGANYTKKMQALKPNMRLMRMLENNGLLDEDKISFLIDVEKKNPKAIQKLLHDSKIDPMDLDAEAEPSYTPGNHRVSDQEMQFHEVLQDVVTSDTGKETISVINSKWDSASKQAVYQEPVLLSIINEQRANGIYDQISQEIERQQMLGILPTTMPFIHAYKEVGDRLHAEGRLMARSSSNAPQYSNPGLSQPQRQVLETRPATPRKPVANDQKAKAASPGPKASQKAAVKPFDPFSMTDEEIMAISNPRF